MEIKKYVPVAEEVEAVLVNKNNLEEVAKWCGGEVRAPNESVCYIAVAKSRHPSYGNSLFSKAFIGDFVVKDASGFFRVYDQKQFLKNHEEVEDKDEAPPTFEYNNYVIYAEEASHRSLPKRLKDHIFKKLG